MVRHERLSPTEKKLLAAMIHDNDYTVVATGIVEVRAAERLIKEGLVRLVDEHTTSVDQWGAGSMTIKLVGEVHAQARTQ